MPKRLIYAAHAARRFYPYVRKYGPMVYSGGKNLLNWVSKNAYPADVRIRQATGNEMAKRRTVAPGGPNKRTKYVDAPVSYQNSNKAGKVYNKKKKHKMPASYKGKLTNLRSDFGKMLTRFNRLGIVARKRHIGTGDDENAVYMLNQSVIPYDALRFTIAAIVRKVLEKMNWRITGMQDTIGMTNFGAAQTDSTTLHRIYLEKLNQATGALSVTGYTFIATSDLFAVTTAFLGDFMDYCAGFGNASGVGNASNLITLTRIYTTMEVDGVEAFQAEVQLSEVVLDVYGESTVYVQNQSVSTVGDSADAENVTNHPVHGIAYYFKGLPKAKSKGEVVNITAAAGVAPSRSPGNQFGFQPVDTGMKILGAASLLIDDFQYPPPASFWWNCTKSGKVNLDPGIIKHYNVKYGRRNVRLLHFLRLLRMQITTGATNFQTDYSVFPTQMVGLTSVINAANHDVTIGYEVDRIFAVVASVKKGKYFRTYLGQASVDETVIENA